MTCLAQIQNFVQEYAETIAEVMELEVTIVDEDFVRIGGTGPHKQSIGQPVPHGSFYEKILRTGQPGIIKDIKKEYACQNCTKIEKCEELSTMGFPIFKRGISMGVIGIMAFTEEQRNKIINTSPKLWNFLKHMSSLLQGKLLLMEDNQILHYQVQEAIEAVNKNFSFKNIVGQDPQLMEVLYKAKQVASSMSTVLIRGESGTGKELLARSIHSESQRSRYPFVAVNCASIPENLLESELFGYEGGAFTGAKKEGKAGKFELAQQGTIFLDEIGDLPLSLQPKLLRVLQDKIIDRIGGKEPLPIDVRIIAATNKNLEMMVKEGTFREDLYYRLNVIPLFVPPLRYRREDVPLYLDFFLRKYCKMLNKEELLVDPAVRKWLKDYHWPGNIRQLENVVEYMVNMCKSRVISIHDVPGYLLEQTREPYLREASTVRSLEELLADYEKEVLQKMLSKGTSTLEKARIAGNLKISLATLYRKIEKYNINP